MTDTPFASTPTEMPVFIDAGAETLFGIATEPAVAPIGVAAIYLRGGNQGPSSGRNQTSTRLCRRLARDGYHAFRLDYRGVGESTGNVEQFHHANTFDEDVVGVVEWFRSRGMNRFVLIGSCFGARTALSCGRTLPGLEALVLLATPVRDKKKDHTGIRPVVRHRTLRQYATHALKPSTVRLLSSSKGRRAYMRAIKGAWRADPMASGRPALDGPSWVSRVLLESIETTLASGARVLFVNGTDDPGFEDFEQARVGKLGSIIETAGTRARVELLEGRVGAFADAALHEPVIELVAEWLRDDSAAEADGAEVPAQARPTG